MNYISLVLIAGAFVMLSYVTQTHLDVFLGMTGNDLSGKFIYVGITTIAIVIAPISSVPLIAAAVSMWGLLMGIFLSVIGWFIGAIIVFELSRSFGQKLILSVISIRSQEMLQRVISKDYTLVSLILLRMSVPVDVLSYALGLFSKVNRKDYYLSTALGIIPFAVVFAYLGAIDYRFQLTMFALAIATIGYYQHKHLS